MLAGSERRERKAGNGSELRGDFVGEAERSDTEIVEPVRRWIDDPDGLAVRCFLVAGERKARGPLAFVIERGA